MTFKKRHPSKYPKQGKKENTDSVLYDLWKQQQDVAEVSASQNPQQAGELEQDLNHPIALVWNRWAVPHGRAQEPFLIMKLLENQPEQARVGLEEFEADLRLYAEYLLEQGANEPPLDGHVRIRVSPDEMTVWCMAFPPQNGGKDIDGGSVFERLRRKRIIYGLDGDQIADVLLQRMYCRVFVAAKGLRPVDGQDGRIESSLPVQTRTEMQADGGVSLKSSIHIQNIKKGEPICRIIPPTEAVSGINVFGTKVNGRRGRHASPPRCKNTILSDDGTEVLSTVDGQVTYDENQFTVEELLVIDGDVDLSVGDIDFAGDVVVNGSVREKFTIRAGGNITINGVVENSSLQAGGNIIIQKGVNGSNQGTLTAGQDITCRYIENCVVYAGRSVYTGDIICSDVACEDTLYVMQGRGAIIGGTCTAAKRIEAGLIGTQSHRSTTVVIGCTPQLLMEKRQLEDKVAEMEEELDRVSKDLDYLNAQDGGVPEHRKALHGQLKLRRPILQMQLSRTKAQLEAMNKRVEQCTAGRIYCGELVAQTTIMMGSETLVAEENYHDCVVRLSQGAIQINSQS